MSLQEDRPLFNFGSIGSSDSSRNITFNNCGFSDIVGGVIGGTRINTFEITSIAANRTMQLFFSNCNIGSHNGDPTVAFSYNGLSIGAATVNGTLRVITSNHRIATNGSDTDGSSSLFDITSSTAANTFFSSDGFASLQTGSDATFNQVLNYSGLPTSDPGVSGQLWNSGGTVKIS